MEKKTKKLQLNKETIAVLNGESMAHIVGGAAGSICEIGQDCNPGDVCVIFPDRGYGICMPAGEEPGFTSNAKGCPATKVQSCESICI